MATSKFLRTFRTTQGVPITTAAIWLVPQANTYPTGALALTAHGTRDGQYYRDNVPDGEYKIYIDPTGGSSPTLYEEEIWIGESRITTISDHFDSTDSYKLKGSGIKLDNSTIETSSETLRVKDAGITAAKLATDAVETAKIKNLNVTNAKIADDTIMSAKINSADSWLPRNITLFTLGTITIDESTGVVAWGGLLYLTNGKGGYASISVGNVTLAVNQMAIITFDDTATGLSTGTVSVVSWLSTTLNAKNKYMLIGRINATPSKWYGALFEQYLSQTTSAIYNRSISPFWIPRNAQIIPSGTISLDRTTGTFSWSSSMYVLNGLGQYAIIAPGSIQLNNLQSAYVGLDDETKTLTNMTGTISKVTWTSATLGLKNNLLLVTRVASTTEYFGLLYDAYMNQQVARLTQANTIITVGTSGENYSTIAAALAAITDNSIYKKYDIKISAGTYDEIHLIMKDYVNLIGVSFKNTIISGVYPDNTAEATIIANSVIEWSGKNCNIENLTIKGTNCRYAIHDDAENVSVYTDKYIKNCYGEHLGNDGTDTYWGHPVQPVMDAFGHGFRGGQKLTIINCTFKGRARGFASHGWTTEPPSYLEMTGCRLLTKNISDYPYSLRIGTTDGVEDLYSIKNTEINAGIYLDNSVDNQGQITLSGCSKTVIKNGSALVYSYPNEIDCIYNILNDSGATIERGMAAAYDGSKLKIRKMTDADDITLFAGIALEEILDGETGDIKHSGYLEEKFINMSSVTSAVFGDSFGVSATAGKLVEGGSPILLKCDIDGFLKIIG